MEIKGNYFVDKCGTSWCVENDELKEI
jgi:hypothetical protein